MRVKFICRSTDDFEVRLVGNHDELGEWNPDRAIPMALDTAEPSLHRWEKYLDLPPGTTVEFKYIKLVRNGFRWERDPNRTCRFDDHTPTCEADFRDPSGTTPPHRPPPAVSEPPPPPHGPGEWPNPA